MRATRDVVNEADQMLAKIQEMLPELLKDRDIDVGFIFVFRMIEAFAYKAYMGGKHCGMPIEHIDQMVLPVIQKIREEAYGE